MAWVDDWPIDEEVAWIDWPIVEVVWGFTGRIVDRLIDEKARVCWFANEVSCGEAQLGDVAGGDDDDDGTGEEGWLSNEVASVAEALEVEGSLCRNEVEYLIDKAVPLKLKASDIKGRSTEDFCTIDGVGVTAPPYPIMVDSDGCEYEDVKTIASPLEVTFDE